MASRIPRYGIWKDGDSHGFTIQFEKVRTFRQAGQVMHQDVLPAASTTSATPKQTEPPMNQDMGPTPPPEATPPAAKARPDSETRKSNDGVLPKDNKIKSIRPNGSHQRNGGRVKSSVDAPAKPQGVKPDELTAKKPTGKSRSKSSPDGSPNVSPPVPEFGAWDKSQNFTDIFKRNQKGGVEVKSDPTRLTTEKPKARNKGGFCKWLCGCCFL